MAEPTRDSQTPAPGLPQLAPLRERRSLREYVVIIRERCWLALAVALLVSGSLAYVSFLQPRLYAASARLQFQRPDQAGKADPAADATVHTAADLKTYLLLLDSNRLRSQVADSFSPVEIALLQEPSIAELARPRQAPAPAELAGDVLIDASPDGYLVTLTARARSADGAALLANRYLEKFVDLLVERSAGGNDAAVDFLARRADELRREHDKADREFLQFKQREHLVSLEDSLSVVNNRLQSLDSALTNARIERLDLEVIQNQIARGQQEKRDLLEIGFIAHHGSVPALAGKLDELVSTQAEWRLRSPERSADRLLLEEQIAAQRAQLTQAIIRAIADLDTHVAQLRATEKALAADLAGAEQEALRLGQLTADYKSLEEQVGLKRSSYLAVIDRLNRLRTSGTLENLPVRVLDRATPPHQPFTPHFWRIVRNSLLLFVALFLGLPLALDRFNDRIKSAWDVEHVIGTQLLAIIPDLADVNPVERGSLVARRATSAAVEAFLGLYSAVKVHSKLDFPKSIVITSTYADEGKGVVSCNFAAAFARHGRTVLLIDADLRQPSLHDCFALPNDPGLVRWIDSGSALGDDPLLDRDLGIVQVGDNFHLLRAGGRAVLPTTILENRAFGDLLESLKSRFDVVVLDTPPIGVVTDALLIAQRTDECVYVCRFNEAPCKQIRRCLDRLRTTQNDVLGIVLNGVTAPRFKQYSGFRSYRSYRKYYGAHP